MDGRSGGCGWDYGNTYMDKVSRWRISMDHGTVKAACYTFWSWNANVVPMRGSIADFAEDGNKEYSSVGVVLMDHMGWYDNQGPSICF